MPQDSNIHKANIDAFSDLKRRAQITRKTRFQASLRLERRQKASYFAISVLSLFVILISLLPNIYDVSSAGEQIFLALTIVNSVFIIITTFLDASGNFVHKGEQLHRSARKVSTVYHMLKQLDEKERAKKKTIRELQKEYQLALDECAVNHDNLDYFRVRIDEPKLFTEKDYSRKYSWFAVTIDKVVYWFLENLWLTPHAIVIIVSFIIVSKIIVSSALNSGVN